MKSNKILILIIIILIIGISLYFYTKKVTSSKIQSKNTTYCNDNVDNCDKACVTATDCHYTFSAGCINKKEVAKPVTDKLIKLQYCDCVKNTCVETFEKK